MAIFSFQHSGDELSLEIAFDKDDLLNLLSANEMKEIWLNDQVANYILENTSTYVNEELVQWEFCDFAYGDQVIIVTASPIEYCERIYQFRFINTSMIREIENYMNLVHLYFNDKQRSFRMDMNRQKIDVSYL